jgi:hypothetical protein
MASSRDGVKCTVQDGAARLHLDSGCVNIPAHLLTKSRFLSDVLTSASDLSVTSDFMVPAPEPWLQAWVSRYVTKEWRLGCADSTDLINCLMVCLCLERGGCHHLYSFHLSPCCIASKAIHFFVQLRISSRAAVHAVSHLVPGVQYAHSSVSRCKHGGAAV